MMRRALFLDRDGVINVDHGHVCGPERFEWIEGIFDTVRHARALGFAVIVVTNQAGIAKGMYTEQAFLKSRDWMMSEFARAGAPLTAVYYCPFHPDGLGRYKAASPMRKPAPGMLLQAAQDWNISLCESLIIGDQETDIHAGRAAGLMATALFSSQKSPPTEADAVFSTHSAAVRWISEISTSHGHEERLRT